MASTYYFVAEPGAGDAIAWFREQAEAPDEYPKAGGHLLHYSQFAPLRPDGAGGFDVTKSPVVSIFEPQVRRGVFWTVGEVHFLAKNAAVSFPDLERLRRRFERWIRRLPVVWDQRRSAEPGHGYYFEGGIGNVADKIYAVNSGVAALERGQYFVAKGAGEWALDRLCLQLRLRGINCS